MRICQELYEVTASFLIWKVRTSTEMSCPPFHAGLAAFQWQPAQHSRCGGRGLWLRPSSRLHSRGSGSRVKELPGMSQCREGACSQEVKGIPALGLLLASLAAATGQLGGTPCWALIGRSGSRTTNQCNSFILIGHAVAPFQNDAQTGSCWGFFLVILSAVLGF